jgi:hypothetical protein
MNLMVNDNGTPVVASPMSEKEGGGVAPQSMDRTECPQLEAYPNLFLKQTLKGCSQRCKEREAGSEFNIATMENNRSNIMYAVEESELCCRLCCPKIRPFATKVWDSPTKQGEHFVQYNHEVLCLPGMCKCCCYQEVVAQNGHGVPLGSTKETCYLCIPTYDVLNAEALVDYKVHMPICMGCLPDICADGLCTSPFSTFYIYRPTADGGEEHIGRIAKGRIVPTKKLDEVFTDTGNFLCEFPVDATGGQKANLLGSMFLLNQLYFEGKNNKE